MQFKVWLNFVVPFNPSIFLVDKLSVKSRFSKIFFFYVQDLAEYWESNK